MSTATTRSRKSKLPGKPAPGTQVITCARPGCGREFPPAEDRSALEPFPGAGDFRAVRDSSRVAGWLHDEEIGDVCPSHRDHVSRWPGAPRLALPARVPGSTRAEFLGVVPVAALPAADDPLAEYQAASNELHYAEADALDDATRKLAALHDQQAAGEDVTAEVDQVVRDFHHAIEPDLEPVPPLPQRKPAGPPEPETLTEYVEARFEAAEAGDVAGLAVPHWQAAINAELSEGALAGGMPLESLAPEHEDEAQA